MKALLSLACAVLLCSTPALARGILVTEDDGRGLSAPPPAGQEDRYVIPSYSSIAVPTIPQRSLTLVTVQNQSTVTCNVAVSFQFALGTTNICVTNLAIPAKQSRLYCSRAGTGNNPPCSITCNPALTANVGHAFVSSTIGAACDRLSVDAQQWFQQGTTDTAVQSVHRLSVTALGRSRGD